MSPRHAVRRSPRRLWWTVAAGNAALGAAVLTAVVVSSGPGVPVDRATSASVGTVTTAPETSTSGVRSDIGDGWATTTTEEAPVERSTSARSRRTAASTPTAAETPSTSAPSAAAGTSAPGGPSSLPVPGPTTGTPTETSTTTTTTTESSDPTETTVPFPSIEFPPPVVLPGDDFPTP